MIFRVLRIDAWAECIEMCEEECTCNAWTWNNWFDTGLIFHEKRDGELTEDNALKFFRSILKNVEDFEIYDDQYNLTLVRKKDLCPEFAIEYGNVIY